MNLKGAVLEGSIMAGINLRVATLKNVNMQNCDLRMAVLVGVPLELSLDHYQFNTFFVFCFVDYHLWTFTISI